jgi:hypothetical protein
VERAKSQIRTLTRYRPSSSEGQRHNDWFTNAHSGSDSVTASTDPERYRPLPSLAVPYPTAPGPNFHHLWWASRPMVTPLKTPSGADPLVRSRRPRRPAGNVIERQRAGPGGPSRTRGSAPLGVFINFGWPHITSPSSPLPPVQYERLFWIQ